MSTIKVENERVNDEPQAEPSESGAGGEDDGSTEIEGDDSHLHEDQKSKTL